MEKKPKDENLEDFKLMDEPVFESKNEDVVSLNKKTTQALKEHVISLGKATISGLSQKLETTALGFPSGNEQKMTVFTEKGISGTKNSPLYNALAVVTNDKFSKPAIILATKTNNKILRISEETFAKFKESNPDFNLGDITAENGYYTIDVNKVTITENGNISLGVSNSSRAILVTAQGIQYKDVTGKVATIMENEKPFDLALSNEIIENASKEIGGFQFKTNPGQYLSENPVYSSLFDTMIEARRKEAGEEIKEEIITVKMGKTTLYSVPIIDPVTKQYHYLRFRKETTTKTLKDGSTMEESQLFISMHTTTAKEKGGKTKPVAYRVSELTFEKDSSGQTSLVLGCQTTKGTRTNDTRYVKMPFDATNFHPSLRRFASGKLDKETLDPELSVLMSSAFDASAKSLAGRGASPLDVAKIAGHEVYPSNTRASAEILSYDGVGILSRKENPEKISQVEEPTPEITEIAPENPQNGRQGVIPKEVVPEEQNPKPEDIPPEEIPHDNAQPQIPPAEIPHDNAQPQIPPAEIPNDNFQPEVPPAEIPHDNAQPEIPPKKDDGKIEWKTDEKAKKDKVKKELEEKRASRKKWLIGLFALSTFLSVLMPFMVIPAIICAGGAIAYEIQPWSLMPTKDRETRRKERKEKKEKEKLHVNSKKLTHLQEKYYSVANQIADIRQNERLTEKQKNDRIAKLNVRDEHGKKVNAEKYMVTLAQEIDKEKTKITNKAISNTVELNKGKVSKLDNPLDMLINHLEERKQNLEEKRKSSFAENKKIDKIDKKDQIAKAYDKNLSKIEVFPEKQKETFEEIKTKVINMTQLTSDEQKFLEDAKKGPCKSFANLLIQQDKINNETPELSIEYIQSLMDINAIDNEIQLAKEIKNLSSINLSHFLENEKAKEYFLNRLNEEKTKISNDKEISEGTKETILYVLENKSKLIDEAVKTKDKIVKDSLEEEGISDYVLTDEEKERSEIINSIDQQNQTKLEKKKQAKNKNKTNNQERTH